LSLIVVLMIGPGQRHAADLRVDLQVAGKVEDSPRIASGVDRYDVRARTTDDHVGIYVRQRTVDED
jgi:hypothetical protein